MKEFVGFALVSVSVVAFWVLLPTDGRPHPLMNQPWFSSLAPLAIVIGIATGGAMLASFFQH